MLKQIQTQEQVGEGMAVCQGMRWQDVVRKMSMDERQVLLVGLIEVAQVEAKVQETMRQPRAMFWVWLSHVSCASLESTKR